VAAGQLAQVVLVPAELEGGAHAIFLLDPSQAGVRVTAQPTTSAQPEAKLELADVALPASALLGREGQGEEIAEWIRLRATAAQCALAAGVCAEALRQTAEFTKTRKQFDQPIAMFQAVGHRAADAFIDTEAVRLTAWQACWRISENLPAEDQVAIAKFWAAEGGQRVVHAAQHLHGGIGVDREYPIHRYFLYAKQLELALGGATPQLVRLGRRIAESAA
jgi:alkylation response protein AidB-like acyl-CoA dehydrogenase